MWTADSTQITADQTCWTADGYNGCGSYAGAGYPVIIYETLPEKTIKKVVKKVREYKEIEQTSVISQQAIDSIVDAMVGDWSQQDMLQKMDVYDLTEDMAIIAYETTIRHLITEDEDLAFLLILASM